nr:ABC transporter permease [Rhizobium sp. Q54]
MTGMQRRPAPPGGFASTLSPPADGRGPAGAAALAGRMVHRLEQLLSACAAILLMLLLGLVLVSVGLRYLLSTGIVGTEEAALWLFLALVALGMPLSLRGPLSLRLDGLTRLLPGRLKASADICADAVTAAAGFVLLAGGGAAATAMRSLSPVLGLPEAVRFACLSGGGLLLVITLLLVRISEGRAIGACLSLILAGAAVLAVPDVRIVSEWQPSMVAALAAGTGLALGAPLAHCLLVGVFLALPFGGGLGEAAIASSVAGGMSKFLLLAIPFFLLCGGLLTLSDAGARLVRLAEALVGHRKAGLAQTALLSGVLFSGASGSSVANAAFGAATFHPHLVRHGYPPERSAAIIAATSVLDNVIPPSIAFLLLAAATDLSVGALLVGGAYAGLLMALCLAVAIRLANGDSARSVRAGGDERRKALVKAVPALGLVGVVVGGIRFGVVTPTEAAALAAGYALLLAVAGRQGPAGLFSTFRRSAVEAAALGLLIGAAAPFAFLLAVDGVAGMVTNAVGTFGGNPWQVLLLCNLVLLAAGLVLDTGAAILLLGPILLPAAVAAGIDPVLFGVILVVNLMLGGLTPPVGMLVFVVSGTTGVPPATLFRAVIPYLVALLCALLALCLLTLLL